MPGDLSQAFILDTNYFAIKRSRLTFPGPVNSSTKNTVINSPAASPLPKKSPLCAENNATDIAMTKGIHASLVKRPMITNAAQKNSAKTTRANDVVEPMWNGSANFGARLEKCVSLSKPWFTSIAKPAPNRKTSSAKANAFSDTLVLNNFFIRMI